VKGCFSGRVQLYLLCAQSLPKLYKWRLRLVRKICGIWQAGTSARIGLGVLCLNCPEFFSQGSLSANDSISHIMIRKSAFLFTFFWLTAGVTSSALPEETADKNIVSSLPYGFRIGILAHDVDGLWSGSQAEGGFDANAEIVFKKPGFSLWRGSILPNLGVTLNNQGDTNTLYGGFIWECVSEAGVFFNTGLGLAVQSGEIETDDDQKKSLGSRVLFRVPLEIGATIGTRHRISILFAHISNAYLADPNEGLDVVGVRYGFQF
jgi:lipid A 3-O-deacylase